MTERNSVPLVAIAGATGNCGLQVLRAARRQGLRARALVRNEAKLEPVRDCVDEVRIVQVTRRESLRGALDGARYLISALGKTYQKDKVARRDVDVVANLNLFDEGKSAVLERVALVTVFGARPDHPIEIVRMKAEAEQGLRESGLAHVIVQPSKLRLTREGEGR